MSDGINDRREDRRADEIERIQRERDETRSLLECVQNSRNADQDRIDRAEAACAAMRAALEEVRRVWGCVISGGTNEDQQSLRDVDAALALDPGRGWLSPGKAAELVGHCMHAAVLTEGQGARLLGVDRLDFRAIMDRVAPGCQVDGAIRDAEKIKLHRRGWMPPEKVQHIREIVSGPPHDNRNHQPGCDWCTIAAILPEEA